jgi:hypothetical protein
MFTTRRETCSLVTLNGQRITQAEDAKYLGLYLNRRLNWRKDISIKRKQLGTTIRENVLATQQQIITVD